MLTTTVRDVLLADGAIAAIVGTRAFDRDVRRAGWEQTADVFDADGDILPTLMVADGGDVRTAFRAPSLTLGSLFVWVFAARTNAGREAVATVIGRARAILHRWRDPVTGAMLELDGRLGAQEDDSGAVFDRATFSVGAIVPVVNW